MQLGEAATMAVKKKAISSKSGAAPQSVLHDGLMARPSPNAEPRTESEKQLQIFDAAMKLFRNQQFREAKSVFQDAATGPQREISHNAKLHVIMCERRLAKPEVALNTLDDHYNYAIERLNARDLDVARKHLDCAMEMIREDGNTSTDHLYYALALCAGISGDTDTAFENLKQAIELNPVNRMAARQDSDLAPIAQQPRIQQLLYPEKQSGPL